RRDAIRRVHRARRARGAPTSRRRGLLSNALYVRHYGAAEGRSAPAARRARRRFGPCRAKSLWQRRAHAWRHAALSAAWGPLTAGDVACRRRFYLLAPVRPRRSFTLDCRRPREQSLFGADALSRPRALSAVRRNGYQFGAQARLCRGADDRRSTQEIAGG